MSKQELTDYIRSTAASQEMQAEWSATESATDLVEVGRERGYKFTVQELTQAMDAMHAVEQGELDESELDMVAGGIGIQTFYEGWPAKWYVPPKSFDLGGLKQPPLGGLTGPIVP